MDKFEQARRRREEYESVLDDAGRAREVYHREVIKLYRSGMTLREIAEGLGLSHQRVHQIVGSEEKAPLARRALGVSMAIGIAVAVSVVGYALWDLGGSSPGRTSPTSVPSTDPEHVRSCLYVVNGSPSSPIAAPEIASSFKPFIVVAALETTLRPLNELVDTRARECRLTPVGIALLDPTTGKVIAISGSSLDVLPPP